MFVLDTGITIHQDDFGSRARWGYDAININIDPESHTYKHKESRTGTGIDPNGHGTFVAGNLSYILTINQF